MVAMGQHATALDCRTRTPTPSRGAADRRGRAGSRSRAWTRGAGNPRRARSSWTSSRACCALRWHRHAPSRRRSTPRRSSATPASRKLVGRPVPGADQPRRRSFVAAMQRSGFARRDALPRPARPRRPAARRDVGERSLRLHRGHHRPAAAAARHARCSAQPLDRTPRRRWRGRRASCWCRCPASSTRSACRWCSTSSAAPAGTPGAARSAPRPTLATGRARAGSRWSASRSPATSGSGRGGAESARSAAASRNPGLAVMVGGPSFRGRPGAWPRRIGADATATRRPAGGGAGARAAATRCRTDAL